MNQFKHIISIPRRAPSNAALSCCGQHADIYFENYQFARRFQVRKSNPIVYVTKKNHGVGIKHSEHRQDGLRLICKGSRTISKHSKSKSSIISLKKKSSADKNATGTNCYYSMCQNARFTSNVLSKRYMSQCAMARNSARIINHNRTSIAFVEKYPRSYAEIIADYSKVLYKESKNLESNLNFNNIIQQSPFGISSIPLLNKKLATDYGKVFSTEKRENHSATLADNVKRKSSTSLIELNKRQENVNNSEYRNSQNYNTCVDNAKNKSSNQEQVTTSDPRNENQCVKLIPDCKSMYISLTSSSNRESTWPDRGLIPKNVLSRNSLELFGSSTRKASSTNTTESSQKSVVTIPQIKEQKIDTKNNRSPKQETESMTSNSKSASEKQTTRQTINEGSKQRESNVPQCTDSSNNDRLQKITELIKSQAQSDTSDKKLVNEPKYATAKSPVSSKKNLTQIPVSGTAGTFKQPQVELRMVPSKKESVVSINVDPSMHGLSQNPTKQLSVVVRSHRKEDQQQQSDNQWNTIQGSTKVASQRNDFGPMRISISENSSPVKQIEFSINGKPVSELKSITARTKRLDVVSSMDKIEIRIPFAKDDASSTAVATSDASKQADLNAGQILNVQISANFRESGKGSGERAVETINMVSTSPHIHRAHYAFEEPVETLLTTAQHYESPIETDVKSDNKELLMAEEDVNELETSDNVNVKIQRAISRKLSADKTITDASLMKKMTDTANIKYQRWNTKQMASTVSSETNKNKKYDKNESSDSREPSKMVPWWSSSDSFSKIKKKNEIHKSIPPMPNRNEKKASSNFPNQDIEVLSVKSKQTPSPKLADSTSTNNSKVAKTDLKKEDDQTSIIEEDGKNGLKMKQTDPSSASADTTSKKDERDYANIEKKVYIPPKNVKASSEQALKIQEQYSLEQINSIDDASSIKSKIENIIDAIRPIERKEDGTLIDYGLKVSSRKPITKFTNKTEERQNIIMRNRRNLLSEKYEEIRRNLKINTSKMIPKRQQIDIGKKLLAKKSDIDELKKIEIKTNALKKKNFTVKNTATMDAKEQHKSNARSTKNAHNNDVAILNSPNFGDPVKLTQAMKKTEKLLDDIMQNTSVQSSRSSESNKYQRSNLSGTVNSSSAIPKSKQLETSTKVPIEEARQERQKFVSNIKYVPRKTITEESEKMNLASIKSKGNCHLSRENSDKKIMGTSTKPNVISSKLADTDKLSVTQPKASAISKTSQPKEYYAASRDSEDNYLSKKWCRNRKNSADDFHMKKYDPDSKSDQKIYMAYKEREFSQKSHRMLKMSQNVRNADTISHSASEHMPNLIRTAESELNMERPEKRELYSVWLQQSKNDNNDNNEKLF